MIDFIIINARYLGSSAWDPFNFIARDRFLEKSLSLISDNLIRFFDSIRDAFAPMRLQMELCAKKTHGVILTTAKCGGGHKSPSIALKQFLSKLHFNVTLVDRDLACEYSEGSDYDVSSVNRMMHLRKLLVKLHPDFILSTVTHDWEDIQLAYDLDKRMILIDTDYALNPTLVDDCECRSCDQFFNKVTSNRVMVLTPSEPNDLISKIAIQRIGLPAFQQIVHPCGFPLRESFVRETNQINLLELRRKMGIDSNEQVLILIHGEHGDEDLLTRAIELNNYSGEYNHPLYVVVVCGNNSEVYDLLNKYLGARDRSHPQIKFKIYRYMSEAKLANYMKVASLFNKSPGVVVGKAGGSTTAECLEMGVYMLTIKDMQHPLEHANRAFISEKGLGEELVSEDLFLPQLNKVLQRKWVDTPYHPLDWRKNLIQVLKSDSSRKIHTYYKVTDR